MNNDINIGQKCETFESGPEVGIINEIGDLGLGFDPISEEEVEKIEEHLN